MGGGETNNVFLLIFTMLICMFNQRFCWVKRSYELTVLIPLLGCPSYVVFIEPPVICNYFKASSTIYFHQSVEHFVKKHQIV